MSLLEETFLSAPSPGCVPFLEGSRGFLVFTYESVFHTVLQLLTLLSVSSFILIPLH